MGLWEPLKGSEIGKYSLSNSQVLKRVDLTSSKALTAVAVIERFFKVMQLYKK
jgi:hypothetical protein